MYCILSIYCVYTIRTTLQLKIANVAFQRTTQCNFEEINNCGSSWIWQMWAVWHTNRIKLRKQKAANAIFKLYLISSNSNSGKASNTRYIINTSWHCCLWWYKSYTYTYHMKIWTCGLLTCRPPEYPCVASSSINLRTHPRQVGPCAPIQPQHHPTPQPQVVESAKMR